MAHVVISDRLTEELKLLRRLARQVDQGLPLEQMRETVTAWKEVAHDPGDCGVCAATQRPGTPC